MPTIARILAVAIVFHASSATAQLRPSNDLSAFRTFDLYTDRTAAVGTTDHVNLSAYPASLSNPTYMVLHTVASVTDTVALLNLQPYNATGLEVNGTAPNSYAEFAVVPPRLATSLSVSANAYLVFAGFNQFDDFLKPLTTVTVIYEDNSTWSATLNVDEHIRGWVQSNVTCGSDVIFPATGLPYDSLVVPLYASGGNFMDMQELRLPRVHLKVTKVRVAAASLDHFCSTFVPHIYAGFRLHAVSLWPRFQVANRAGNVASLLRQDDASWGSATYGGYRDDTGALRSTDSTIAYDGCLLTCVAMMHRYFGASAARGRPDSLNDFLQRQGGYRPSFGVVVDSVGPATSLGSIVRFLWAVSSAPNGATFDVEGGTDSVAPYPIATVRVVNGDATRGRAQVIDVQRPTLSMFNRQGTHRGEVWLFRASFDYSNHGWYTHGLTSVDSLEAQLADSLPVVLQVEGRQHWVVATGMSPAWLSSTQAQGTYPVLDPLRSPGARLFESPYGNTFQQGIVGWRFAQAFPAPDGALAVTSATATPELGILLSGPGTATITDPIGRTTIYDAGADRYVSQNPDVIARRSFRHGNVNDPAGLFGPLDDFEIPNAISGTYTVDITGQSSGIGGLFAEASSPGVRITDALRRFGVSTGNVTTLHISYDASGGTAIAVSQVTSVEPAQSQELVWLRVSPNPVIGHVSIAFDAARGGVGHLDVFDIGGRRVATLIDGMIEPGQHAVEWFPRSASSGSCQSGIYFVRFVVQGVMRVAPVVLLRQ
jgi:hypothetical protein